MIYNSQNNVNVPWKKCRQALPVHGTPDYMRSITQLQNQYCKPNHQANAEQSLAAP